MYNVEVSKNLEFQMYISNRFTTLLYKNVTAKYILNCVFTIDHISYKLLFYDHFFWHVLWTEHLLCNYLWFHKICIHVQSCAIQTQQNNTWHYSSHRFTCIYFALDWVVHVFMYCKSMIVRHITKVSINITSTSTTIWIPW